jgi:hypothetical protein
MGGSEAGERNNHGEKSSEHPTTVSTRESQDRGQAGGNTHGEAHDKADDAIDFGRH